MGGKLFHSPRMPRADYLEREAAVRVALDGIIPGAYRILCVYGDKADFGDMDILCASGPDGASGPRWEAVRDRIVEALGVTDTKAVGHVYSLAYRGLQTDLFTVEPRYLDSMYDFMSFNDVGNFIGRICRRFDLKYGEHGLSHVYRGDGGNFVRELALTQDFARVCGFLGLDHAAWQAGFASLPAVFEWVIASPYFSVAPYLDVPEGTMRARGDRPTVTRFISYLRERAIDKRAVMAERSAQLPAVLAAFPDADLPGQLAQARAAQDRHVELRRRFSGERVMRLCPGVRGRALGELMAHIREVTPDFDGWLLASDDAAIDAQVVRVAEAWREAGGG